MNADTIVDQPPFGYRWALEDEAENWTKHREDMVQVRIGGTDDEPWTDLMIKWDCMIERGMNHDHNAEACERYMAKAGN